MTQVGLFSSNESIEELPTSSIKFLLLPARLGRLTIQRSCSQVRSVAPTSNGQHPAAASVLPERMAVLNIAKVYYEDFLIRCKQYELTTYELPRKIDEQVAGCISIREGRPTPEVRSSCSVPLSISSYFACLLLVDKYTNCYFLRFLLIICR